MIKEFELDILKYITRAREGGKIIGEVPDTFLIDPGHAIMLHVLKAYYEEFGRMPYSSNLNQYIKDAENLTEDVEDVLRPLVVQMYDSDFKADREHLKHKISKSIQIHKTNEMISDFMDKAETDDRVFDKMFGQMRSILSVADNLFGSTDARYVLKDFTGFNHIEYENVITTPFRGMDEMMSAGGIFAPQILVIMAPPKGFKSAIMVNMAIHSMLQGKKVFYADFENGEDDIINRCYCRMTEANYEDMKEEVTVEMLKEVVKFSGVRGGDIYVKSYEMFKGTPGQVRADIEKQIAEGEAPDVIIWDYADVAAPTSKDDQRLAKRLQIQSVYGEIKNINKEYKTVSITASQMNRASIGNASAGMADLAEDIGKAANADAIWAVLQTEDEVAKKVGRLQPVIQRKGVSFSGSEFVYLKLQKDKQLAEEISFEEWYSAVEVEIEDDLEDI